MRAENVTGPVAHHGEGPTWWPDWGGLRFVDAEAADLLTLTPGGVDRLRTDQDSASFVRPRAQGGYVVGTLRGIALADSAHAKPSSNRTLIPGTRQQMNDAGVTPEGELLAGSMSDDGSYTGRLYRIAKDLSWSEVESGIACSNGIAFAPSAQQMYYVDTLTSRIDIFTYSDGALLDRRVFTRIPAGEGLPDGLTVDSEGNVWVALWGAGEVRAFSPDGSQIGTVRLPVAQVTACSFGDDDLGTLYITTSRKGLGDSAEPDAGSLFQVRPGVVGLAATPFAG